MADEKRKDGAQLEGDITFIATPAAKPSTFSTGEDCGVKTTNYPTINNPPLPAEGPGNESFSNWILGAVLAGVPLWVTRIFGGGLKTFIFFFILFVVPLLIAFWTVSSRFSPRINDKAKLPGRPVEHYLTFKNEEDRKQYSGRNKIPIQTFAELYTEGLVDINGDLLDALEYRHDWSNFAFTYSLFRFIFLEFAPDVIFHSRQQDEDQIKPTYDKGNDHYSYFLGPRMVYTSGLFSDLSREETLEEMQDNKMAVVCEKLGLKEGETMLDIGCGWGTLAKFASVNYGAKVTGATIASNQAAWGNDGLRRAGIPESQSQILCMDYRDIPTKKFNKISQLEMGEHVGIRRLTTFFRQCYDMLEDDGAMYVQLSGLRKAWQYEDFIWGLYLNKHIFPGADASTPLANYVGCLESAGWEIKSIDTVGVHYSGTLWRWYRNWLGNAETVHAKYGQKWYRIWELFLAWSVIASRQGSATCFQMVVVKNLNATHRIDGFSSQFGLSGALAAAKAAGKAVFPRST
ncbi:cyclopropane-fatty-acyl-phospholipid synthase [Colletotrichum scovillei]|uniref:sphingolipid C(9)-methyltransferase n=1 Tax=Colletotrichum scovillei TaxID=1209932 RepID=A0A9P7QT60_9PEZI|nr:cyclopropane-fatty-acyl-phospholipid synthase [Colletotrichum scovillei]KAF4778201.1 cyclopropane-fatty-acyl-phospholipid synthase [Colletotrichum scovillei]KAG7039917.1 cyclopropane-fatty-acyl-phospholipid synthase [Colletotrichum scovillei]KAG7042092.1 cyclopropane-fatty-acyl-phospholipid synthase [Colletotrichum scovillei]KAG7062124.1 cyclopropane-fatty-acyl-phospholipid synthase [Colletotrichum scovillei]